MVIYCNGETYMMTSGVIYAEGAQCETLLKVPESASDYAEYLRQCGYRPKESYCAPVLCNGVRKQLISRARSAVTPWLGPQKIDLIRTRLE